jgi:hypothetical protein
MDAESRPIMARYWKDQSFVFVRICASLQVFSNQNALGLMNDRDK